MRNVSDRGSGAGGAAASASVADPISVFSTITVTPPTVDRASSGPAVAAEAGRAEKPGPRDYARPQAVTKVTPSWLFRYTVGLVVADFLVATIAAVVGVVTISTRHDVWVVTLFPLLWVVVIALGRTYEHRFVGNGNEEYRRLFNASVVSLALLATLSYAFEVKGLRGTVVVSIPLAILLTLMAHWVARQGLHQARRRGECMQRTLVVGRERSVAELIRTIKREPHAGLEIVGTCIDQTTSTEVEGVPVLGGTSDIVARLVETGADTVAVTAWSDVSQTDLRRLAWDLEGSDVTLLVAPRLTDLSGPRIHIRPVAGLPLLNVEEPEFSGVRSLMKYGIDRVLALVALLLLSPVLLATAVAIKATSRGPVFFRQLRVGRHGKPFVIHKFRSMYVDAEERLAELEQHNQHDEGPLFKMRNDPRVTPVGRVLRRFSIDELPQLLDVLLGTMSLVGPRPPLPREVEQYPTDVRRRLIVKPGITGLWQVSGRSDLTWEESVRLDLLYVENWSLSLDLVIILKTVVAVLRRQGAY